MRDKIQEIINGILINNNKNVILKITDDMHLIYDIGLDSLDLAELTVRIEALYDLDVFEEGVVKTFGEVLLKLEKVR